MMGERSKSQQRRENVQAGFMQCGHPRECIAATDEGTNCCRWCEEVAAQADEIKRLRDALNAIAADHDRTPRIVTFAMLQQMARQALKELER